MFLFECNGGRARILRIADCIVVNIKWGKEKFEDVHCNTDEPPIVFKAALFSLSGVQPDRQKVMYKGVVIKVSGKIVLI